MMQRALGPLASSGIVGAMAAAMAAIAIAALGGACRNDRNRGPDQSAQTAVARDAAAAPAAAEPAQAAPKAAAESAEDRDKARFEPIIATHLAAVPDPALLVAQDADAPASPPVSPPAISIDNHEFRDRAAAFVRQVAAGPARVSCALALTSKQPFRAVVRLYHRGAQIGRGEAMDAGMCEALKQATRRAVAATGKPRQVPAGARFIIELPDHDYALAEHQGKGVELSHGLVPVRMLDKALLGRRIDQGKAYLLRTIDPEHKGVHKYYRATTDEREDRLHTIYTASTIFTLLKLHAYDRDQRLRARIRDAAGFLLSMQQRDPGKPGHGGFYYSFDLSKQQPEPKLVVGTTSKTIFTLIELHAFTKDDRYLQAATRAADWLVSMQRSDGAVRPYLRQKQDGSWVNGTKESMLYTGQVLSALSRTYGVTRRATYLDAADLTAGYLADKVARQGCYLGDDYRQPNPISSSWVILSLFDFVKATGNARAKDIVFRCADELLEHQLRNPRDVYRHGRWRRSLSSSGNGWLAEVMSELFLYCRATGMGKCDRFRQPILDVIRLLMQYTYTAENAFVVENPEAAAGGVFWNVSERYVRTDSVCHAMNAYINMIPHLGDGPLVELPEPPLAERLSLVE